MSIQLLKSVEPKIYAESLWCWRLIQCYLSMKVPNSSLMVFWIFSVHNQLHWSFISKQRMFKATSASAVSANSKTRWCARTNTLTHTHTHTVSVERLFVVPVGCHFMFFWLHGCKLIVFLFPLVTLSVNSKRSKWRLATEDDYSLWLPIGYANALRLKAT